MGHLRPRPLWRLRAHTRCRSFELDLLVSALVFIPADAPSVTDWIGALATASLGLLGLGVTLWQWRASGFRIKLSARIDKRHEAIELRIINKGRGTGIVERVIVETLRTNGTWAGVAANVDGFDDGQFVPMALPGSSAMNLIIKRRIRSHSTPISGFGLSGGKREASMWFREGPMCLYTL